MIPWRMIFWFLWLSTTGTCWPLRVAGDCSNRLVVRMDCFVGRWYYIYIYILYDQVVILLDSFDGVVDNM